jgi:hypothetical protein
MPLSIEIFKAGRHVPMAGRPIEFGEREIEEIVGSYDPALHEAPVVIGHPTHNGPAYGWVKGLARSAAGSVEARVDQLEPNFTELVRAGRYKKISISLYRPDSPQNPTPGRWYLRHVGFLGASPPAVKGLAQVELAEDEAGVVELAELDASSFLGALRRLLAEHIGEDEVAAALGTSSVPAEEEEFAELDAKALLGALRKVLAEHIGEDEVAAALGTPAQAEPETEPTPADMAERKRLGELRRRERELEAREAAARRREHEVFLDGLIRDGRPLPCKRELLVGFLELLERPAATVSFGEGERRSAAVLFREEVLARLPKRVVFGEVGGPGSGSPGPGNAEAIAQRAAAYREEQRAKGHVISTSEAVRHVRSTGV